ncbi:hypothetical protein [Streptomyces sp. NBC_00343]|uniref:hypothetical protein n=1 Tax=Streptomyces sp. NBC_00343 TaxID=2975719 RepID=UPI002E28B539|nr:hypothetical protein [Streptomyces sp. NBC_00343]
MPDTGAGVSAAQAAGRAVGDPLGDGPFVHTCQLSLVPARRSADVPAIVGWAAGRSASHAEQLALEHVLSTADNMVDDPPTPFPEYANRISDAWPGNMDARPSPVLPSDP